MKKNGMKFVICFFLLYGSHLQGSLPENTYLAWQKQHAAELANSFSHYISTHPLRLLQPGPAELFLDEQLNEVRQVDENHWVATLSGMFKQKNTELFALFFIYQQIEPYKAEPLLVYTCSDPLHLPSMRLYLDVMSHAAVKKNYLSGDFQVHINTLAVEKDSYQQEWIFYNEESSQQVQISFSSDQEGGLYFMIH